MFTEEMYGTKRFKFPKHPKKSYIDTLIADGKKKQDMGPTTYKNIDPTDEKVIQADRTGAFGRGIVKSLTDQGAIMADAEFRATQIIEPGKYTPNFVSLLYF